MLRIIALASVIPFAAGGSTLTAAKIIPVQRIVKKDGPVRVLVPSVNESTRALAERLRQLKFEVELQPWDRFDPRTAQDFDVIFLPTNWAYVAAPHEHIESRAEEVHAFVRRGGGLIVGQPNSHAKDFTPKLLPFPITFDWRYDKTDVARQNLAHDHFITEDLPDAEMPFPADAMTKVDQRYRVLAKQKSTGALSLAVTDFGAGRIVAQTGCEHLNSYFPLSDEMLRRMVVWAARREPERNK